MTTTDRIRIDSQRDPAELEREIHAQRQRVETLVAALEERISPGELVNRVLGYSKDGGRQFASNLSHTVRANPVPTLLTAAGMLWLYSGRDRPVEQEITVEVETDSPGVRDRLSGTWDRTRDKAGSARQFTSRQAHRVGDGFHRMLEDNPVALGALGVAAGALLGAMLPSSETEDRWMGDMRERVGERMREGARDVTRGDGAGLSQGRGMESGRTPMH